MAWARSFLNQIPHTWFLNIIQNEFRTGKIDLDSTMKLLETLQLPFSFEHVKHVFKKTVDKRKTHVINIEDFRAIYRAIVHRAEFQELFRAYSPNRKFLADTELIEFLRKEQHETETCETLALEMILKHEPIEEECNLGLLTALLLVAYYNDKYKAILQPELGKIPDKLKPVRKRRQMSFEGFIRYMNSEDCSIFKSEHRTVYQDMNHPLCDYFISSSHNTYLISDQLIGPSDLWGYVSALLKGCRCLEIDCWDGSNNEPVVYHGHTLTSKILFNSVIRVIDKYAFVASDYPVVLSLENHCSPEQQEVMAEHLETILGDKLLTSTIGDTDVTQLPSPEIRVWFNRIMCSFSWLKRSEYICLEANTTDSLVTHFEKKIAMNDTLMGIGVLAYALKFKILVKNKKVGTIEEGMLRRDLDSRGETGEVSDVENITDEDELDDKAPLLPKNDSTKRKSEQNPPAPPRKKAKIKKIKIALALSDLVIYTKSQKFVSFEHSLDNQKCYENNSIGETKARKFVRHSAKDFVSHTSRFITRIYPKGTRTTSSNYNPQEFWNVGCQMVALNFQTPGVQMELQNGKFLDNGGCGYILKPEFLRDHNSTFTPQNVGRYSKPMSLSIRLISGHQLPPSNLSKTNKADPLVHIEIYGVPEDQAKKKSSVVKSNALSPRWDETFSFTVQVPELALIRFCVEDEISLVANEFLGQYTLPLLSLRKGYRTVPLLSKDGDNLKPASLFVHIWYY